MNANSLTRQAQRDSHDLAGLVKHPDAVGVCGQTEYAKLTAGLIRISFI